MEQVKINTYNTELAALDAELHEAANDPTLEVDMPALSRRRRQLLRMIRMQQFLIHIRSQVR